MNRSRNNLVSVMTWNIYFGSSLEPLANVKPAQIPLAATEIFRQFLATNFRARAKVIARQIILQEPDIIGLQEAARWELIPPNVKPVVFDFIDILLQQLENWGFKYKVAVIHEGVDITLPDSLGNRIRLLDREVTLIRESSNIQILKRRKGSFNTNLVVDLGGQPYTILRGWTEIQVSLDRSFFKFVNTHLEPLSPEVRLAQAIELLKRLKATKLPIILTGDFNEDANNSQSPVYRALLTSGFNDVWAEAGKGSGFTWSQAPDLLNAASLLSQRINLILFRNKEDWEVLDTELAGESQLDRTKTRLWPSNHAGVAAGLKLECN